MLMDTGENEILVLGDGDFSYSASLVPSMNQYNLTSTVFLSLEELLSTYGDGECNILYYLCIFLHSQLYISMTSFL